MERIDLLQRAFPGLPDALLQELACKVRERTYPMGTVLCKEGESEDVFYIIGKGRVVVSKFLDGEASRILSYQDAGEFFGELALVQDSPRAATVVTLEETTVFELNKQDFMTLLESSPDMVTAIMRAVAARLRETDRRSIQELRRKNAELNQAYQALQTEIQQRSNFLTAVAHQLRAPLTTVKDHLKTVEADDFSEERLQGVVETVSDNVDDIIRLVNSILFLQELELIEPQFRSVAVDEIVRQAINEIRPVAERIGLSMRVEIAPQLLPVWGDASSLKQAVLALLENAVRASLDGGEIHVSATPCGHVLEITVRDYGLGISEAELEHLFEHTPRGLAGDAPWQVAASLSLPIAKAVVEQHKGLLLVASQEGRGSTFTIRLPVTTE